MNFNGNITLNLKKIKLFKNQHMNMYRNKS